MTSKGGSGSISVSSFRERRIWMGHFLTDPQHRKKLDRPAVIIFSHTGGDASVSLRV